MRDIRHEVLRYVVKLISSPLKITCVTFLTQKSATVYYFNSLNMRVEYDAGRVFFFLSFCLFPLQK